MVTRTEVEKTSTLAGAGTLFSIGGPMLLKSALSANIMGMILMVFGFILLLTREVRKRNGVPCDCKNYVPNE